MRIPNGGTYGDDAALLARASKAFSKKEQKMTGYCMKCKEKREIQNAQQIVMKNGRPATQGTCPVCNTKIFKIGKSNA